MGWACCPPSSLDAHAGGAVRAVQHSRPVPRYQTASHPWGMPSIRWAGGQHPPRQAARSAQAGSAGSVIAAQAISNVCAPDRSLSEAVEAQRTENECQSSGIIPVIRSEQNRGELFSDRREHDGIAHLQLSACPLSFACAAVVHGDRAAVLNGAPSFTGKRSDPGTMRTAPVSGGMVHHTMCIMFNPAPTGTDYARCTG